jgi:predicted amidophosphoribosyltransferase
MCICEECGKPFERNEDGNPYCDKCFEELVEENLCEFVKNFKWEFCDIIKKEWKNVFIDWYKKQS